MSIVGKKRPLDSTMNRELLSITKTPLLGKKSNRNRPKREERWSIAIKPTICNFKGKHSPDSVLPEFNITCVDVPSFQSLIWDSAQDHIIRRKEGDAWVEKSLDTYSDYIDCVSTHGKQTISLTKIKESYLRRVAEEKDFITIKIYPNGPISKTDWDVRFKQNVTLVHDKSQCDLYAARVKTIVEALKYQFRRFLTGNNSEEGWILWAQRLIEKEVNDEVIKLQILQLAFPPSDLIIQYFQPAPMKDTESIKTLFSTIQQQLDISSLEFCIKTLEDNAMERERLHQSEMQEIYRQIDKLQHKKSILVNSLVGTEDLVNSNVPQLESTSHPPVNPINNFTDLDLDKIFQ